MIQAVHCFVANYFWVSYLAYLGHGRSQLPLESRKETVKEKLMRKDFKLMRREKKRCKERWRSSPQWFLKSYICLRSHCEKCALTFCLFTPSSVNVQLSRSKIFSCFCREKAAVLFFCCPYKANCLSPEIFGIFHYQFTQMTLK